MTGRWRMTMGGAALAAIALAGCARQATVGSPDPAARPDIRITDGESLLRAMHARYDGRWYRTLTFRQATTISVGSQTLNQMWFEAAMLPGRLRIDTDTARRSGSLYRNDSLYSFNEGRAGAARRTRNALLVFGFDVYTQPPATTIAIARQEGYDLAKLHETTWQGKATWVMGAGRGDTTSRQLWVEKERLLPVRWIEPLGNGRSDTRFNQYVAAGGGWVAVEVIQYLNGRQRLREEYHDVRTNVPLDSAIFNPARFASTRWWK